MQLVKKGVGSENADVLLIYVLKGSGASFLKIKEKALAAYEYLNQKS